VHTAVNCNINSNSAVRGRIPCAVCDCIVLGVPYTNHDVDETRAMPMPKAVREAAPADPRLVWKLEYSAQVKELGTDKDGLSKVMCVLTWVNSD